MMGMECNVGKLPNLILWSRSTVWKETLVGVDFGK